MDGTDEVVTLELALLLLSEALCLSDALSYLGRLLFQNGIQALQLLDIWELPHFENLSNVLSCFVQES